MMVLQMQKLVKHWLALEFRRKWSSKTLCIHKPSRSGMEIRVAENRETGNKIR
jgi:hypothetical protein